MKFLKRFLAGMCIGTGAAIPGVSGAAIAVIFKVYEYIIDAINNIRKRFGHSLLVLLPILLGVLCAVVPCIYVFSLAFEHLMFVLICIFAGFLIGSFPSITEKVKGVKPNKLQIVLIICGALFVITLGVLSVVFGKQIDISHHFANIKSNWWLYLVLVPVGTLAAFALTVPGLSGSLMLLVLGFYRPLIDSAKTWGGNCLRGDWSMIGPLLGVLGCFALGNIIGVVFVSKIMAVMLEKHRNSTYFTIIGFVAGSVFVLFFNHDIYNYYLNWAGVVVEGTKINPVLPLYLEIPIGIVVLIGCAIGSYTLVRLERKNRKEEVEENKETEETKKEA